MFLFDARSGKRISEEFRVSPRYGESDAADDNEFEDLKSTAGEEEFGVVSYSILSDPNANKVKYFLFSFLSDYQNHVLLKLIPKINIVPIIKRIGVMKSIKNKVF